MTKSDVTISLASLHVARADVCIAIGLVGAAATAVASTYARMAEYVAAWPSFNFWFDADPPLILHLLTSRSMDYPVTQHHPLFLLLTYPVPAVCRKLLGVSEAASVGVLLTIAAAAVVGLVYTLLRTMRLARLEATLFTLLAGVSSFSVFWFPIPEHAVYGAITLVIVAVAAALLERGVRLPGWGYVVVASATLAVTTTNFMAGVVLLAAAFRWRVAAALAAASVAIVCAASVLQMRLFPHARFFLIPEGTEQRFMFHGDAGGPVAVARAFLVHAVVMPRAELGHRESIREAGHLTVQGVGLTSGDPLTQAACALWIGLLAVGACVAVRSWRTSVCARVMCTVLAGQLALHVVFGIETFLYALHWGPLLVAIAALAARTRMRRAVLIAAGAAVVLIGWNNVSMFQEAAEALVANHAGRQR